ncbi:hypothetical protein D3H35_07650 [Cohnella faecalis]|uniref:Uncharacterized protein n=1 Tax=Cohnella faecalis TaxID=2315694 RepID=A0A398CQK8_9BACL|nr:hypothetical protein D3H35_07650 [Cohnella faecalis]
MGEEKPDEELMGKRKSSPRLSPTPLGAGTIIVASGAGNIHGLEKKMERFAKPRGRTSFASFRFVVTYTHIKAARSGCRQRNVCRG